ncbi:MAG: hypothetical protein ACI81I_000820 [Arcobacteraceae bacterium]|jgi:hypothetical protein
MSFFYQVTLNQGRSDTVTVEADSLTDVRTFFSSLSTANITMVKKIVYSKDLSIGTATTSYLSNNQDNFLRVLVESKSGYKTTLNISFPLKHLTKDMIVKSIIKNLLCNNEKIIKVLNIIVSKK